MNTTQPMTFSTAELTRGDIVRYSQKWAAATSYTGIIIRDTFSPEGNAAGCFQVKNLDSGKVHTVPVECIDAWVG